MRLTAASRFENFGGVQIHELQRVIELDSGSSHPVSNSRSLAVSRKELGTIEQQMAIVVLCMNEELKTIDGVISGIPHDCLIILVSNSDRYPFDRYQSEVQLLQNFCVDASRSAIAIHQKDLGVAKAFACVGGSELVNPEDGLVYSGKGEAMVMGMALAATAGVQYIGYVDADNYIPGSVSEYCKVYAAGLHLAMSSDSMVRISWGSKPKERNGRLMFDRTGRSSRVVNEWLNSLLQQYSGFGTDIIMTGNAGEHAMTMNLGLKLRMASGFAVEPYEYIYLFENFSFSGIQNNSSPSPPPSPRPRTADTTTSSTDGADSDYPSVLPAVSTVHIHQIETRNPHIHENKGDDHVQDMRLQALNMMYHSPITPTAIREALLDLMVQEKILLRGQEPARERVYPAVGSFDLVALFNMLSTRALSFYQINGECSMPFQHCWQQRQQPPLFKYNQFDLPHQHCHPSGMGVSIGLVDRTRLVPLPPSPASC